MSMPQLCHATGVPDKLTMPRSGWPSVWLGVHQSRDIPTKKGEGKSFTLDRGTVKHAPQGSASLQITPVTSAAVESYATTIATLFLRAVKVPGIRRLAWVSESPGTAW